MIAYWKANERVSHDCCGVVLTDCVIAATPISGWTPTSKDNKEKRVTIKAEEWTIEDLGGIGDPAMWVDEPSACCGWTRVVYEANPYDGNEM